MKSSFFAAWSGVELIPRSDNRCDHLSTVLAKQLFKRIDGGFMEDLSYWTDFF